MLAWMKLNSIKNFLVFLGGPQVLPVLTLVAGTFLGPGVFWQLKHSGLEEKKGELDKARQIIEFREKMQQDLVKIIEISNNYLAASSIQPDEERNSEISKIRLRFDLARDNFIHLEALVAGLENRPPKPPDINLIPPRPPSNVRVQIITPPQ